MNVGEIMLGVKLAKNSCLTFICPGLEELSPSPCVSVYLCAIFKAAIRLYCIVLPVTQKALAPQDDFC